MRAEYDRHAEHGGLEHRVQAGAMKTAADECGITERVEIGQDADPIDDDHRTRFCMLELRQPHGAGQLEMLETVGDSGEMIGIRLMRSD